MEETLAPKEKITASPKQGKKQCEFLHVEVTGFLSRTEEFPDQQLLASSDCEESPNQRALTGQVRAVQPEPQQIPTASN